ncbi:MAG TPA: peptidase M48, partial [Proteobacteria bacterium]|nr:peptidase M48 [Pseudomonadota bacterium]
GCRKLPDSPLRRAIIELCRRQRVGWREIMLWPPFEGRMATAAVVGAFPWSRYLLITPDLLRLLDGEEVLAVMSHELGHVRYRHLLFFLLFFVSFFLFNYLYFDLAQAWLLTTDPIPTWLENSGNAQGILLSLLEIVPLLLLHLVFFRYFFGWFLRNFERQADLASLDPPKLTPALITAFEKLGYLLGSAGEKPNWHHFNIPQRLEFLRAAQIDPQLARRHHRRLQKALSLYLISFLLLIIPGLHWQNTGATDKLHYRYLTRRVEQLLREKPDNARLWLALSSIHLERQKEIPALQALEQAHQLDPNDPETINNLAWLLLTIADSGLRDYDRAFLLAAKAAALRPAPHILDTLAEAYWRRGDAATAIALEEEILGSTELDNREHYLKQREKFSRKTLSL